MADVTFTVDGKKLTAPAGTLLIDACRAAGIEIPSFCYYPNLSLQAACRMCLVEVEKMPKLQTACTLVAEVIAERALGTRLVRCGVRTPPDGVSGSQAWMQAAHGLSAPALAEAARAALARRAG